jgi:hypothetical protein
MKGTIQWKGTDVCCDINCSCGESFHFDGMFMYYIRCPHCNQVFECDPCFAMTPVEGIPEEQIRTPKPDIDLD